MKTTMQRQYFRSHQRMNTHFYDGKLKGKKEELDPYLIDVGKIEMTAKLKLFTTFSDLLSPRPTTTPQSQRNLKIIVDDYRKYGPHIGPNYDSSNNLASEDLLYLLAYLIIDLESDQRGNFLDLTNQQLTEMSSGLCPQGRAYRLLQIIGPAIDFPKSL